MSPGGAAAISAGASVLGGAFGGGSDGYNTYRSHYRKMRHNQLNWDILQAKMMPAAMAEGARNAGLHPLFALGGGMSSGGSGGVSPPMAGQSNRGNRLSDAVESAQRAYQQQALYQAEKDLIDSQAELARSRALEQVTSNDNSKAIVSNVPDDRFDPRTQHIETGGVQTYNKENPEQSKRVQSPFTKFRLGSQTIWVPFQDMDTFLDNPFKAGALTWGYKGNKDFDYALAWREYTGGARPVRTGPSGHPGTKVYKPKVTAKQRQKMIDDYKASGRGKKIRKLPKKKPFRRDYFRR